MFIISYLLTSFLHNITVKTGDNLMENAIVFMKKHPVYHATIHSIGGVAVGILIMYIFNLQNPLLWVLILGAVSVGGHLYAATNRK